MDHSIFGASVPPGDLGSFSDAGQFGWLADQFYSLSGANLPANLVVSAVKIYVPAGSSLIGKTGSVGIARRAAADGGPYHYGSPIDAQPWASPTAFTTPLAVGWNTIPLSDQTTPFQPGDAVIAAYGLNGYYLYAAAGTVPTSAIQANDGTEVYLAENLTTTGAVTRSFFCSDSRSGSLNGTTAEWYGIDLVLSEGAAPGPTPEEAALMSNADLELAYLISKGATGDVEVGRNLFTNPSFEAASGTVEVRRNLATSPLGADATATTGYGAANGATIVFDAGVVVDTSGGTVTDSGVAMAPALDTSLPNGPVTISVDVTGIVEEGWRLSAQGPWVGSVNRNSGYVTVPVGVTKRISLTITRQTGNIALYLLRQTAGGTGKARINRVLVEASSVLGEYFDGTTSPDPDLTPSWTGAPNASASVLLGTGIVGEGSTTDNFTLQSGAWAASGQHSVRVIPRTAGNDTRVQPDGGAGGFRLGMQAGKTYTILATCRLAAPQNTAGIRDRARTITAFYRDAGGVYVETRSAQAPNVAGETDLRVTFTIPAGATEAFVRLYNGATVGNGDVWWDNFAVIEGEYTGDWFDGVTSPDPHLTPSWTGAPNASPSVLLYQGKITLKDARRQIYTPNEHAYFAALSGLSKGSLADHKLAYYKAQTGKTGSLQDLERAFWVAKLNA